GGVGKGIAAGIVIELVLADVRIDGQQGMRVEGVLETGSQAPGQHALVLILAERVVGIGNLDPVARGEQIQVEYVLPVGLIIEAVENGLAVALVVEGCEFRGIQERPLRTPSSARK